MYAATCWANAIVPDNEAARTATPVATVARKTKRDVPTIRLLLLTPLLAARRPSSAETKRCEEKFRSVEAAPDTRQNQNAGAARAAEPSGSVEARAGSLSRLASLSGADEEGTGPRISIGSAGGYGAPRGEADRAGRAGRRRPS